MRKESDHVRPRRPRVPPLRSFFLLWSGQAVSLLGTQAVQFALVWWLTVETGSPGILALATLLALLPRALGGPAIGAWVDRLDRRTILFAADATAAALAVTLAGLFLAGAAAPAHVLALLFLRGVAEAFHESAMLAATTTLVAPEARTRVQGANQALQGLLAIVAPPLGALIAAFLPMPGALAIDAFTALFAIGALLLVRIPHHDPEGRAGARLFSADVVEGVRWLLRRRGHLALLGMAATINLFVTPAFSLLPVLVHDAGAGAGRLGALASGFGIGMLAGGALLAAWGGFRRKIDTALCGMVALGAATAAVAALPADGWALLGALVAVGAAAALVNGAIVAILQDTVPVDRQGRVFATYGSLALSAAPLGLLLAAPVAETLGVRAWYVAGGVAAIAAAAAGFGSSAVRRIEEAQGEHVESAGGISDPAESRPAGPSTPAA